MEVVRPARKASGILVHETLRQGNLRDLLQQGHADEGSTPAVGAPHPRDRSVGEEPPRSLFQPDDKVPLLSRGVRGAFRHTMVFVHNMYLRFECDVCSGAIVFLR